MYVSRSTDGGAVFSPPYQLAPNTHTNVDLFQDKEYVAVDNTPGSPYNGNIGHASTGAGTVNKAVNGTVTAPTAPVAGGDKSMAIVGTSTGAALQPKTFQVPHPPSFYEYFRGINA